ncbi:efflux transporter outer membrane subunit [Prosthecobacter sp.]|uniref:efflux transporter outer membrane subunit n=1 Tax=Prosthecobacter sp. TaxID=1965333 RepID=UPI0037831DBE
MRPLISSLLLLATSAVAQVGPDYVRPETVTPPSYKSAVNWREARPLDTLPKGAWWRVFGDAKLNALMERATAHNQTLKAAIARFDTARAGTGIARAAFFPTADVNAALTTQRTSPNMPSAFPLNGLHYVGPSYNVPLDFSWELDLWGKIRRQNESARADAAAAANVMQNVLLGMHADVATNYFRIRALDGELATVRAAVGWRRQALGIAQARVKAGAGSELEQAQAETEVASAEAEVSALQNQRDQLENAIALLTGTNPSAFKLGGNASMLPPPPGVPAGVPTDLLERRPDVAAAERTLASTTAQIGVTKANFFPSIRLTGRAGYLSGDVANLFEGNSLNWNIGPSISVPVFAGGKNRAYMEKARAAHDEALANYRQAILVSFNDVENALAALRNLSAQSEAQHRARDSAQEAAKIAHARYEAGTSPYLNVIEANRSLLLTERACATLAGQRLIASVSLIKALGGGWDQSLPVTVPVTTPDPEAMGSTAPKKGFFTKVKGWFKKG